MRWQVAPPSDYRHWVHQLVWVASWLATRLMRTDIQGQIPSTPCIIVSNHLHYLDIPLSGRYAVRFNERAHWLAKVELFRLPVIGAVLRAMQTVPVDRGKPDRAALERIIAYSRTDKVVIFPEGHRSSTGHLQPGKEGIALIARRSGSPLVPVAIAGTEDGLLPLLLRRKTLRIVMGEPFTVPSRLRRDEALRHIMARIAHLLPATYQPLAHDVPS